MPADVLGGFFFKETPMNSFKIQIPAEMFETAESMRIVEPVEVGVIASGADSFDFEEPVDADLTITNTGGALLIQGSVEGSARTDCARCLEDAIVDIHGTVEGYILIPGEQGSLDDLEQDEYTVLADDKVVDLAPFLEGAIRLDLPRVPLCTDDCKGLCPACGQNLNAGSCRCGSMADDTAKNNPFAVLKDLDLT